MKMNIETNKGQATQGGDIHNHGPVNFIEPISGGLNIIGNQGEIHLHVTLSGADDLSALVDLLMQAKTR
jgi:hypothetical protein